MGCFSTLQENRVGQVKPAQSLNVSAKLIPVLVGGLDILTTSATSRTLGLSWEGFTLPPNIERTAAWRNLQTKIAKTSSFTHGAHAFDANGSASSILRLRFNQLHATNAMFSKTRCRDFGHHGLTTIFLFILKYQLPKWDLTPSWFMAILQVRVKIHRFATELNMRHKGFCQYYINRRIYCCDSYCSTAVILSH